MKRDLPKLTFTESRALYREAEDGVRNNVDGHERDIAAYRIYILKLEKAIRAYETQLLGRDCLRCATGMIGLQCTNCGQKYAIKDI